MTEVQNERERCAKIVEKHLFEVGRYGTDRFTLQAILREIRGRTCVETGHSRGGGERRCIYCNEELEQYRPHTEAPSEGIPAPISSFDNRYAREQ